MTRWIELTNYIAAVAGLIVSLMGFVLNLLTGYLDRWSRRFFALFFTLLIAYVASDLLGQFSLDPTLFVGSAALTRASVFCESLLSSLLMPLLTLYMLRCAGEGWRRPVMAAVLFLWAVYFALLVFTQFTTLIYTVTPQNVYLRGPWYPVLLAPPALLMLTNLAALWHRRKALSRRQALAFALYLAIPLACMIVQMLSYGLLMIVIGTSVAALSMLIFIITDQVEKYVAQQRELVRQRSSIMVLQMRPHFIYNTMMSIYYLCQQDAEKAQRVTLDFTTYLRKNFTAIAREERIPFPEELEHTRAYLAVEQVRFEGELFVAFDTPHTTFRLPPLTLQPIVENAVKHGVDPELKPLHIAIRTRATDRGSELTIEDTGPGFAPADDDEPHIALANITERLAMMCGGSLEITPRQGGGTVVRVLIPNEPQERTG